MIKRFFQRDRNHKKKKKKKRTKQILEPKNSINGMGKNAIKNISRGVEQMEDRVSKLEGRNYKITNKMRNEERRMKNSKESLYDL